MSNNHTLMMSPMTFQASGMIDVNQLNKTRVPTAIIGSDFLLAADLMSHAAGLGALG